MIHVGVSVTHKKWSRGISNHAPTQQQIDRSQMSKHLVTSQMLNVKQVPQPTATTRRVEGIEMTTTRVQYYEADIPKLW